MSLVWPNLGSNPQSTTLEASTLTITPPMRLTHYWKLPLYQFKSLVILYHFACRFFAFNKLGKNVTLIVSCIQIYFCYIVAVGFVCGGSWSARMKTTDLSQCLYRMYLYLNVHMFFNTLVCFAHLNCHDITEILLKVVINTITLTLTQSEAKVAILDLKSLWKVATIIQDP